ncbi:MAG TPA: SDR family oxidoreductase [Candidatus Brocadiia bacterium]|nr:SDR family oxidoreductase [Candidatus Brocadiia bacterium]
MGRIFMTGGAGFLGAGLIGKILRNTRDEVVVLVEPGLSSQFDRLADSFPEPGFRERLSMAEGDISKPGLGLAAPPEGIDTIWHLAAIYRLDVEQSLAERVNVTGTANVLDFAEKCPDLKALNYVSTCYVSGKRKGRVLESELDKGQEFNNWYESTKFKAEVLVRKRMDKLPTRIIRPAIVTGDSKTGATVKFDGVYYAVSALANSMLGIRLLGPSLGAIPGNGKCPVNFVPSDYLLDAAFAVSQKPDTIGMTFQIADPNARSVDQIMETLSRELGVRTPRIHLPFGMAVFAFKYLALDKIMGLRLVSSPPFFKVNPFYSHIVPYCDHWAEYDTTNVSKALEGTGISCPTLESYAGALVRFWKSRNPEAK